MKNKKYLETNSKRIIIPNEKLLPIKLLEESLCGLGLGKCDSKSRIHLKITNCTSKLRTLPFDKAEFSFPNGMKRLVTDWK